MIRSSLAPISDGRVSALSKTIASFFLVTALVGGIGCTGGAGGVCVINDDCGAGGLCQDGTCVATCEADSDCTSDESCSNGICVAGAAEPDPREPSTPQPSTPEPGTPEPDAGTLEPDAGVVDPDAGPPGPEDGGTPEPSTPVDGGVGPDVTPTDGGDDDDAGVPTPEDGGPIPDGGGGPIDGGGGPIDGGGEPIDGGGEPIDGGGPVDGGNPVVDGGVEIDAGPPAPTAPTLTSLISFGTRTPDVFVFDFVGTDPNQDPAVVIISVFNAADQPLLLPNDAPATGIELPFDNFVIDGDTFSGRFPVFGFLGLQNGPAARVEIRIRDETGLAPATGLSVATPGIPTAGQSCPVPDEGENFVPCPGDLVCNGADIGVCGTTQTANAPVLDPIPTLARTNDAPGCTANPNTPDSAAAVLTGTSDERIVGVVFAGNPANLQGIPVPPAFSIDFAICVARGFTGNVEFFVVDEANRQSNTAVGLVPPAL